MGYLRISHFFVVYSPCSKTDIRMQIQRKISRVNKITDAHGKLSNIEYFYEVNYKQRLFLKRVINIIDQSYPSAHLGWMPLIRKVLRTGEYSENSQDELLEIRKWYIILHKYKK